MAVTAFLSEGEFYLVNSRNCARICTCLPCKQEALSSNPSTTVKTPDKQTQDHTESSPLTSGQLLLSGQLLGRLYQWPTDLLDIKVDVIYP
jgi:hypothetical protein